MTRRALYGAALLAVAAFTLPAAPVELWAGWYMTVAVLALGLSLRGVVCIRPDLRGGWTWILAGFTVRVLGDVVSWFEKNIAEISSYPGPSDAVYLASYLCTGLGIIKLARTRGRVRDLSAVLDAVIVTTAVGIVVAVFAITPLVESTALSPLGKVAGSAYPVADLFILATLVRLLLMLDRRDVSFHLLAGAVALTLVGDTAWTVSFVRTGRTTPWLWDDALWLTGYTLLAAAVWVASNAPSRVDTGDPRRGAGARRLTMIGGGLLLPPAALIVDGMLGSAVQWLALGLGAAILSTLILVRVAGLLRAVEMQAERLTELARTDPLTGAPNRRTWDHELVRASQEMERAEAPVCVVLIDLDHFKRYNDTHGHQAGDRLLREAVAAWNQQLPGGAMLSRYGGEEFAVLLRGSTPEQACAVVERLNAATPEGQTLSAGIARLRATTPPFEAVALADNALYEAKRAGRNRIVLAAEPSRPGQTRCAVGDPV